MSQRKQRANGIASRRAILDATARIAGERGYEGTTIKAVSEQSGQPVSSIYWHFKDKDELIAAVIDRSFTDWVASAERPSPAEGTDDQRQVFVDRYRERAEKIGRFPDFLRLGLMLMLERRPDEPSARQRFQEARAETLTQVSRDLTRTFPDLDHDHVRRLATLTLAGADGLFVAAESGESDLVEGFETLARAVHAAATTMADERERVEAGRGSQP